jgi:gamma-glutamyl:cysteine ligase YbdK (ATP-grasp superfamily)
MGIAIDRSTFEAHEYEFAGQRLRDNLQALRILLARPGFGRGEHSIGAEVELALIDAGAHALPLNRQVLADSLDPHLQLELDRFNLEYNLTPVPAAGKPFGKLQQEIEFAFRGVGQAAGHHGGRIVAIGILPTLELDELQSGAMTDLERYRALQAAIRDIRREDFHIRIDGAEPLDVSCDSVTVEGANTSFQLHLRVNPEDFARFYNAAQLATPLALAIAANSPFFLGHDLWDETRVALFKQAVDTRPSNSLDWHRASRVPFGQGWVRHDAFELFAEACFLYKVLIPVCSDEDPLAVVNAGGLPRLAELRLHQGTIWGWNRPVYDAADGGHLRIELRALPSGPTPIDMVANGAFLLGLVAGFAERVETLLPAFPFRYAEYNFYRAAQHGLGADLLWPSLELPSPVTASAAELCREHLELAAEGLDRLGVGETERLRYLGVIRDRLDSGVTPAAWQRRALASLGAKPRRRALEELVERYLEKSLAGRPVSDWD